MLRYTPGDFPDMVQSLGGLPSAHEVPQLHEDVWRQPPSWGLPHSASASNDWLKAGERMDKARQRRERAFASKSETQWGVFTWEGRLAVEAFEAAHKNIRELMHSMTDGNVKMAGVAAAANYYMAAVWEMVPIWTGTLQSSQAYRLDNDDVLIITTSLQNPVSSGLTTDYIKEIYPKRPFYDQAVDLAQGDTLESIAGGAIAAEVGELFSIWV